MQLKGYRAFLLGTAQDQIPVRGIWFTVHRRDDEEGAATQLGVLTAAGSQSGVSESNGTDTA